MIHQDILIDKIGSQKLNEDGFVVVPFLNETAVNDLVHFFKDNHVDLGNNLYASAHSNDTDFRLKMSQKISDVIQEEVAVNFKNASLLGASFIVKPKNLQQPLQPHQDWNIVDETQFRSYNIWIPLVDLNEYNGAILVMPKSHSWVSNYRHSSIPCSFEQVHQQLWENMSPLFLKAGEALIYDHALIHASLPNTSDSMRIACACGIIPNNSEMRFYWNNQGKVEEYESSKEFFLTENVFKGPHGLKKIRDVDFDFISIDENRFNKLAAIYNQNSTDINNMNDKNQPEINPQESFWKVYSIPNIIREIKHRVLTLVTKNASEESTLVNENKEVSSPKYLDIPLHTTTQVGAFYNEFNDKFLQVYGDVIQAFRTQDVSILLDYQIEAMQLKEGMRVLDAGCGVCGPATYFAEKTGVSVNAITISEEQVNRAEEKIQSKQLQEKVTVKKGDYHNIKSVFPDVEYDVVYFLESFGHSPYHEKALDSAWEVLKPGGLLYIKDLFKRLPLLPEHEPKIDREIKKINEAYRYNVADLNTILDYVRKKGWIVAAVKTIDLKMEEFENLMISNEFQELTGIAKIENWDDYIFPIDFFELFLYKPQFDLKFGLDKYFLQNLMYMQVHGKKQEEL